MKTKADRRKELRNERMLLWQRIAQMQADMQALPGWHMPEFNRLDRLVVKALQRINQIDKIVGVK